MSTRPSVDDDLLWSRVRACDPGALATLYDGVRRLWPTPTALGIRTRLAEREASRTARVSQLQTVIRKDPVVAGLR